MLRSIQSLFDVLNRSRSSFIFPGALSSDENRSRRRPLWMFSSLPCPKSDLIWVITAAVIETRRPTDVRLSSQQISERGEISLDTALNNQEGSNEQSLTHSCYCNEWMGTKETFKLINLTTELLQFSDCFYGPISFIPPNWTDASILFKCQGVVHSAPIWWVIFA